jgi:signal transduction histidine kinase
MGMRNFVQHILDPEIHLRDRLFQLLSVIALAEFVFVSVYTIVTGGDPIHIMVMLAGTVLFALTVALTFKTGKMRVGATISGLLYFMMYPLTFFPSGGMYGGAPVVFAFALVYVFLVTQKWERVVSLIVCIAVSCACYVVSYLHPELLMRHTVMLEGIESFLSILLVTLLLCTLFAFITGVYTAENRIVQKQKKEIEDLNRSQKSFFSNMSHEIRTPVNAIIGLNEMTLREDISDEVRDNAQGIEVASKTLLHTVNEILDVSQLETGRMNIVPGDYRTTSMFSDIVNMVWLRAQDKGLEFEIRAEATLPSVLHGDEARIKQILLNVTTNAVKYTKEGSVTLAIAGRTDETETFWMVYDVSDTGIGIREESIPHLFTAFERFDEHENRSIEGTGLGLSIVKQLLDLMGGTVSVSSEYGKGSTFHIEIPQVIVDRTPIGEVNLAKQEKAELVSHRSASVLPPLKVLVVDDTPMNLKVVTKLLRDTDVEVDTAESGSIALQKTLDVSYDVILMDHQMPGMDGIECLHRIRAQEGGLCRSSKIVCLTANVGAEMEQLYQQEGFDGYLAKPVRGETLEGELARLAQ